MKNFERDKSAEELGIDKSRIFVINSESHHNNWKFYKLSEDDWSCCPYFNETWDRTKYNRSISWVFLSYLKTEGSYIKFDRGDEDSYNKACDLAEELGYGEREEYDPRQDIVFLNTNGKQMHWVEYIAIRKGYTLLKDLTTKPISNLEEPIKFADIPQAEVRDGIVEPVFTNAVDTIIINKIPMNNYETIKNEKFLKDNEKAITKTIEVVERLEESLSIAEKDLQNKRYKISDIRQTREGALNTTNTKQIAKSIKDVPKIAEFLGIFAKQKISTIMGEEKAEELDVVEFFKN